MNISHSQNQIPAVILGLIPALLGILMLAAPLASQSETYPLQALQACRKGDYKTGKQGFETWLKKHPQGNGRVEYNLGNCEYRLDHPARALWRWKRAERRLGGRPEILHNIALVQRQLSLPPEEQAGLLQELKSSLTKLRPADYWRLTLLFEIPALALLFLAFKRRKVTPLLLGVILYLPAVLSAKNATQSPSPKPLGVVVLQDDLPLRTEPRPSLSPTARLPKGLSLPLLSQSPDWLKVRYGRTEAWVPRSGVGTW